MSDSRGMPPWLAAVPVIIFFVLLRHGCSYLGKADPDVVYCQKVLAALESRRYSAPPQTSDEVARRIRLQASAIRAVPKSDISERLRTWAEEHDAILQRVEVGALEAARHHSDERQARLMLESFFRGYMAIRSGLQSKKAGARSRRTGPSNAQLQT